ncbi:MAG TPA: hypothetical protein PKW82_05955, partial [Spirochaetales bacterium]|nr:hypothetical protein [Spirochaetales bacterium]
AFLAEGGAIITSFTPECQEALIALFSPLSRVVIAISSAGCQGQNPGHGVKALCQCSERRNTVSSIPAAAFSKNPLARCASHAAIGSEDVYIERQVHGQ